MLILDRHRLLLPVLFGVEAATKAELAGLGYQDTAIRARDGQVELLLSSEEEVREAVARLNFALRTAERVLYEIASFPARTFDEVYFTALSLPWERWVPSGFRVDVNGFSRQSTLFGVPALQRTLKKAIVGRLLEKMPQADGRWPEGRSALEVRFLLVEDELTLALDTTGDGLHKRGYRPLRHQAPIRETLAAAILYYAHFLRGLEQGEALVDPMCGSGTFPIEAALLATNTAPGLKRHFAAEGLPFFGASLFDRERERLKRQRRAIEGVRFYGADSDGAAVGAARANAVRAGVGDWVHFSRADLRERTLQDWQRRTGRERLLVLTNPPYGERLLSESEAAKLVAALGRLTMPRPAVWPAGLRFSALSPSRDFERDFGRPADRRRKLYNGRIPCTLFQYFRPSGSF